MATLAELQRSCVVMEEKFQKDNHHCNTPLIWAVWQSGQDGSSSSPQWKTHESLLGVCIKAPEGLLECEKQDALVWWNQDWTVSSCCGGCFSAAGTDWSGLRESKVQSTQISLMKTWSKAIRTSNWTQGSPSNRIMTLSAQPRQCRSGFHWMSLSGPARARTWTKSNISGETWKWTSINCPHPTLQSLRRSTEKTGRKSTNPGMQLKLVKSYPRSTELRVLILMSMLSGTSAVVVFL